jgi:hypothetical protein
MPRPLRRRDGAVDHRHRIDEQVARQPHVFDPHAIGDGGAGRPGVPYWISLTLEADKYSASRAHRYAAMPTSACWRYGIVFMNGIPGYVTTFAGKRTRRLAPIT